MLGMSGDSSLTVLEPGKVSSELQDILFGTFVSLGISNYLLRRSFRSISNVENLIQKAKISMFFYVALGFIFFP